MTPDDAPPLADLMPWSVAPPRLGRGWPAAPDAGSLKARWDALVKAEGPDREALFVPTRSRTLTSAVAQLPGRAGGTGRLAREPGPCPEPVRVLAAPFDEQWLIPDHRLIDSARPELWRVADERQVFVVEQVVKQAGGQAAQQAGDRTAVADSSGPLLLASPVLPLAPLHGPRVGRVRPLYRRPGAAEPNLAPGLAAYLGERLGTGLVDPVDVLAWILVAARPGPDGAEVPLPAEADAEVWSRGVELGRRALWLMRRDGQRPKLPGGRRPYVRAPLPARPVEVRYDRDEESLVVDEGRISPVPSEAWGFHVGGVRVLEEWFTRRTEPAQPGTLEAIRPTTWPQAWTSELLELITVLALLAELRPGQAELKVGNPITTAELRRAGVLPVPDSSRRPASVLDHREEGPEGQFTLL